MTRIDFYVLSETRSAGRDLFACRLAEKAYKSAHTVHLHVSGTDEARRLDDLLWTFRDISFVPHEIVASAGAVTTPVSIGHESDVAPDAEFLINLTHTIPAFFERFDRLAEVVDSTDESRRLGRERFRHYRDKGYTLHTHHI